jgi:Tfp pilus assembly protein PilP
MKKNLTMSLIIGWVCFLALLLAPDTHAQKSDSQKEIRKQIIKKKIYPMPRVKSVISMTPPAPLAPKPKSVLSRVSQVRVTKNRVPSSSEVGKNMLANTVDDTGHDIPPYTSTGKVDPFVALIRETVIKKPNLPKPPPPDDSHKTVLEKIDLSQLKLTAIVTPDKSGHRALVEESSGKGHIVVLNTKIGTRGGKVVEIQKDRIIIEEKGQDDFGRNLARKKELILPAIIAGK